MDEKKRILIVDDNESMCRSLRLVFEKKGYETETAETGREAIEKVQGRFFNLAFLDINLPDMEGTELLPPLKETHPDMAVILVTGHASLKTAMQALNNGASGYITKPLDMDEVLSKARDVLEKQRLVMGNRRLFQEAQRELAERKRVEEALRESEEMYKTLVQTSPDAVTVTDLEGHITEVSQRTLELHGFESAEELLGRSTLELLAPEDHEKARINLRKTLKEGFVRNEEYTLLRRGGTRFIGESNAALIKDAYGKPKALIVTTRDITERKQAEEKLAYMATHDPLTGLPNRMLFNDRLTLALAQAHRNQQKLAVMLLDLDHLKDVNDTLGHSVGDKLLQAVGERLTSLLRKSDTVARMGGDEFMLILPEIARVEDTARVAQKVLESFRGPFVFDGHEVHITTSIGIAIYPADGEDADTLVKNTDIAMYRAKAQGRNNYQHYF
jgi:diguanylate cyclase (GGDEF)-like protein/PAS domain S-box-containing protein